MSSEKRTAPDGDESRVCEPPRSLTHPISPPLKKRRLETPLSTDSDRPAGMQLFSFPKSIPSPFRLTRIRDLPANLNQDTVTLKDLLGDPLISECWEFNYMHDIDFLMSAFDEDTRHLVKVHVVHGFWKREDLSRVTLHEQAARYPNVALHAAYMPEMFGTHHSKMMILLRHDDTARIVIHTANMIVRDWTNMTQAVWMSPWLPLMKGPSQQENVHEAKPGSGAKFKVDLLNYLRAYDSRGRETCKPIIEKLMRFDFSEVKGALIASVPGRHKLNDSSPTRWGWAAMEQALKTVPVHQQAEIAIQISSIATLGPTDNWLKNTFSRALSGGRGVSLSQPPPSFKVIFPTADEIRKSLDGYASGGSIHTKIQSPQQVKQLQYLRPMFCHWANDSANGAAIDKSAVLDSGRKRAAPHIKTYIRYGNKSHQTIDWALLTSANLSKQAWGEAASAPGGSKGKSTASSGDREVRIASYEIGVLVWPELWGEDAAMKATFMTDNLGDSRGGEFTEQEGKVTVALRMPYSLPLQPYDNAEVPWVATTNHEEPDWMGQVWRVE